jgi:hypothetical protein
MEMIKHEKFEMGTVPKRLGNTAAETRPPAVKTPDFLPWVSS